MTRWYTEAERQAESLAAVGSGTTELSLIEQRIIIDCWGLHRCCCDVFMSLIAKGLDRDVVHAETPVLLAYTGNGKTTLIEVLQYVFDADNLFAAKRVFSLSGKSFDKAMRERVRTSDFVIVDDVQHLHPAYLKKLRYATGEGYRSTNPDGLRIFSPGDLNAMLLLAGNPDSVSFGKAWQGSLIRNGYYFIQRNYRTDALTPQIWREFRRPGSMSAFMQRLLTASPVQDCEHTIEARAAVEEAYSRRPKRVLRDATGKIVL